MSETLMTAAESSTEGSSSQSEAPAAAPEAKAPEAAPAASEKPAATKEAEAQTAEAESKASDGKGEAPAELADFTAPEGVQLDAEAVGEFKNLAKELGLQQEGAQKIADIGAKLSQKWEAKQAEKIQAIQKEWTESAKADKEFGGDALGQNLATAKKALDTFGSPELRTLLNESGLGNHPEIIRAFFRAGKAISEDRFVNGGGSGRNQTGDKDYAKSLYPNQG